MSAPAIAAYETVHPTAVLPALTRLVEQDMTVADAKRYRTAARRLHKMRLLAAGTTDDVDKLITTLRDTHRNRPRLQREFDRANLP